MQDISQKPDFETLYAANAGKVYRFALRLVGNKEVAEDLASESLSEAFLKWDSYRGNAHLSSWLFAIVLNRWRMTRRKQSVPIVSLDSASEIASTFRFPNLELAYAISSLSDPLRIAFLLVHGEGLTHAEAAKTLGVPVGTVYFRVFTAIRKLRTELEPELRLNVPPKEVTCDPKL
jgi:RNA polymerase sigma factor (sigma-70 family)